MRKFLPLSAMLLLCMGLVAPAAQAARHTAFGFYRVDAYRLVFSGAQNAKLDAVLATDGQGFLPLYKERRAAQRKLADMLKCDTVSDADIRAQVSAIGDVDYRIALKKAKLIRAIRTIATPEQLAKVDALEAKRAKRRKVRPARAAKTTGALKK